MTSRIISNSLKGLNRSILTKNVRPMSGTSPHTPSQNLNEMNQFPEIFKKIKKVKPPGKNPQKGPGAPPPPKKDFIKMYELLEEAQSTNLLITGKLDDKLLDYIHDNVKVEVNLELRSWYERRKINRQLNEAKELDIDKSLFGLLKNVDPTGKFNKETPNYYNRLVFRGKLRMLSELQSARIFLANNFVNQEIELIDHLSSYEKELINSKLRYSGKFKNAGGDALNLQNDHHSYEDLEQFLKIYTYFDVDFTINKIVKIEITDISKGKQEAGITSFADALKGKLGGTVMNSEPKNPKQD